jgi:hypothetical protein
MLAEVLTGAVALLLIYHTLISSPLCTLQAAHLVVQIPLHARRSLRSETLMLSV